MFTPWNIKFYFNVTFSSHLFNTKQTIDEVLSGTELCQYTKQHFYWNVFVEVLWPCPCPWPMGRCRCARLAARAHGVGRAAPVSRGRGRTCSGNGVAGTAHLLALSPFAAANGTTCAASCYAPNKHQQIQETYRVVWYNAMCWTVFEGIRLRLIIDKVTETIIRIECSDR